MNKKKVSADDIWKAYDFLIAYKNGEYGPVPLQEAIDNHYDEEE